MPKLLAESEYHRVLTYKQKLGMSNIAIAEELGIKRQTVAEILKRHQKTNSPIPKIKGHKHKTKTAYGLRTPDDIKRLLEASRESPYKTPKVLREELGLQCSLSTIKRRLQEFHIGGRIQCMKSFLTEEFKQKRYAFAKNHVEYNWKNVIFSDEIRIETVSDSLKCTRISPSRRYNPDYFTRDKKRASITVWGCMTYNGLLDLVVLQERLTGERYVKDILEKRILDYKRKNPDMMYVHDSASPHRAKCVKDWMQEKEIQLLDWPIHSADLMPISRIWDILKAEVGRIHNLRRNQERELTRSVLKAWSGVQKKTATIRGMYNSIKATMESCVNKLGGDTRM